MTRIAAQVKGSSDMKALDTIAEYGLWLLGVLIFFGLIISYVVGTRIGVWRRARAKESHETASFVTNGMLGLLAFTLGLTIAMAQGRYDDRRRIVLNEANAIGTAWLRAGGLGHPRATEIARLLEEYITLRVTFVQADFGSPDIARMNAETNRLQGVIWGHAAAIGRERADPLVAALNASLNETFDLATTMRWAFAAPLPGELIFLLFGMSILAISSMGFQFGVTGTGNPILALLLLSAWTASMLVVADLSAGRLGAVRPDVNAYVWTQQGFRGGVTIPPAP